MNFLVRSLRIAGIAAAGLLVSLSFNSPAHAQAPEYFPYFTSDTTRLYQFATQQRNQAKAALAPPKGVNSDYRKDLDKFLKSASQHVYYSIRYSALLDSVADPYVQQIYKKVIDANPGLPPTRLVVTRNPVPNASALVDGTILFNVGLLSRIENESQVAAVISHELAHIVCRHLEKSITARLNTVHNKEFKKEVKAISKDEFGGDKRMRELIMGLAMNSLYHSRNHEKQADSLGYVFLSRTAYDATQMYTMLQLLDHIDEPIDKNGPDYSRYFGCQGNTVNFTPKEVKSASIFQVKKEPAEEKKSDTLKTHPDCEKRMAYIQAMMAGKTPGSTAAQHARFARVREVSRLESVQSWFDLEYYDYALFEALQLLKEKPNNGFLQSIVLLSLYELRRYQKNHDYSQVVSNISDRNPPAFNQFLRTLHDLQLSDFKTLSNCFKELAGANTSAATEHGIMARYAELALADKPTEAELLKKEYLGKYKGGRFQYMVAPPTKSKRK